MVTLATLCLFLGPLLVSALTASSVRAFAVDAFSLDIPTAQAVRNYLLVCVCMLHLQR